MVKIKKKRMKQFRRASIGQLEGYSEPCCFCGKIMTDIFTTHNPSPLNNEESAVCCDNCANKFVRPVRLKNIMEFDLKAN